LNGLYALDLVAQTAKGVLALPEYRVPDAFV